MLDFPHTAFWARMLYTLVLLFVVWVFVYEGFHIWWDRTLFIGRFEFFDNGARSDEKGQAFAIQVVQEHRLLVALFQAEYDRRKTAEEAWKKAEAAREKRTGDVIPETTQLPVGVAPVRDPKSELADVELSVQGINIKQILLALRRAIKMPNEVTGMVDKSAQGVYVSVQWPRAPLVEKTCQIPVQRDTAAAAFQVASYILWAQTRSSQNHMAQIPRQEFCSWAEAWLQYDLVRSRSMTVSGLLDEDKKSLDRARALLDRLILAGPTLSEVYRLRADIINLTPDAKSDDKKLAEADLIEYARRVRRAMTPTDVVSKRVLEATFRSPERPTIIVKGDSLKEPLPATWAIDLNNARSQIQQAIRATGRLITPESSVPVSGTAFVVGPDLVMTASFAVQPQYAMSLEFDDETGVIRYPISEVVFRDDSKYVAILRVPGLDENRHPQIALARKQIASDSLVDSKVFVTGYTYLDQRLPTFVQSQVSFSALEGVKRVMPGLILRTENDKVIYDAMTMPGTAGGPVIDFKTGQTIAIHWGGRFLESSKESYGTPTWIVLKDARVRSILGLSD